MRKILITIKYIDGTEKINVQREVVRRNVVNVQREVVRRNVVNYRIKKKDTGEASFIYRNKNRE